MSGRLRLKGTWRHGASGSYVSLRALDALLAFLSWGLALEATIRGLEFLFMDLYRESIRRPLHDVSDGVAFGINFFGVTMFIAGVSMVVGMLLHRYTPIIFACLIGAASYFILSVGYLMEFLGNSSAGLRTVVTFLLISGMWATKGFFVAGKHVCDTKEATDKEARK